MAIARALPEHFNARGLEEMGRDLGRDRGWVALEGTGDFVGFVVVREAEDGSEEILWLAVSPAAQRRGVGRALVEEVARDARARGVRTVRVRTLADTVPSPAYAGTRAFYLRLGFRLEEVVDPYPGWEPGNPCAVYERPSRRPRGG